MQITGQKNVVARMKGQSAGATTPFPPLPPFRHASPGTRSGTLGLRECLLLPRHFFLLLVFLFSSFPSPFEVPEPSGSPVSRSASLLATPIPPLSPTPLPTPFAIPPSFSPLLPVPFLHLQHFLQVLPLPKSVLNILPSAPSIHHSPHPYFSILLKFLKVVSFSPPQAFSHSFFRQDSST